MEAFTLDTSGEVMLSHAPGVPAEVAGGYRWSDLSPFAQGYIEAAFASLMAERQRIRPIRQRGKMTASIYDIYRSGGEQHADLDPHFRCGRLGVRPPSANHSKALAAWDAGYDTGPAFRHLAPATLARILKDCEEFQAIRRELRAHDADNGAHFWEGRQQGAWRKFPPLTLYLGDDGLIRFEEGE